MGEPTPDTIAFLREIEEIREPSESDVSLAGRIGVEARTLERWRDGTHLPAESTKDRVRVRIHQESVRRVTDASTKKIVQAPPSTAPQQEVGNMERRRRDAMNILSALHTTDEWDAAIAVLAKAVGEIVGRRGLHPPSLHRKGS